MKRTVNTKLIKRLSDLDFGFEVKVGIGELLSLTECGLYGNLLAQFSIFAHDGVVESNCSARML
jgi:hypothetical protein